MDSPRYDPDTEGLVYIVKPDCSNGSDGGESDSDMETSTISSASTLRTASTITSDELGDYFREASGRTYAQDENLPLIYPVDGLEVQRHRMQHAFLKALMHGNYVGPVRNLLRPRADGTRPRVLDIRTCAGDWAQDMATEFPHCDIVSVDIAPIASHAPRPNIAFEIYDLYAGIAEPDESFDYVSCRHVQLHVKEYDRLIFDLHRVLKPGGLVTICEVENRLFEVDQPPYNTPAYRSTVPSAARATDLMRRAVSNQGVNLDDVHEIAEWIKPGSKFWAETAGKYEIPLPRSQIASRGFKDIDKQTILIPVGPWHPDPAVSRVGDLVARAFAISWQQLEPLLVADDSEGIIYVVQPSILTDCCDREDSDVETVSSASTSLTTSTITSEEIGGRSQNPVVSGIDLDTRPQDYFREAHGLRFAHDENLPLTYPVDDVEVHRHRMQHIFIKALVHGNYIGPVKEVLRHREDGYRPRILDIRTCAGDWAQDMAAEFPHCDIISIDIAPITTHTPRPNIQFEVYDLYAGIAEPDESFDYVSCRHVQLHVKEYDRLVFDLHRVLRPGGLITICEVENYLFEVDHPPYNTIAHRTAPNTALGVDAVRAAVQHQGIDIDVVYHIDEWLRPNSVFWTETAEKYGIPASRKQIASRGFRDVHKDIILCPVGTWHPELAVKKVGALCAQTFALAFRQLEPAIVETGILPENAKDICTKAIEEMTRMDLPLLGKYHMVYGTKN